MSLLDEINKTGDVKNIPEEKLPELAMEIRKYLLKVTSKNGGHLASNLGSVELTIILHRLLDLPKDKIIWDVGHQAYTHKILTGRKEEMETLRKLDGISGFPKRYESDCDAFGAGHSSTSIAAAMGFVAARDLRGSDEKVVAVIGDGALTGGEAFEALNNAGKLDSNLIIILNDNERSISRNVGGMAAYLDNIRTSKSYIKLKDDLENALTAVEPFGTYILDHMRSGKEAIKSMLVPGMLFEDMGLTYLGPVNGHDFKSLERAMKAAMRVDGAVLIHVITKKGKGYKPAEWHPARFHGVDPFYVRNGEPRKESSGESCTHAFSEKLMELAKKDKRVVAITAAMPFGTGLYDFKNFFPDRFFDVGIAEEYAVTFAAGMAADGMIPVVAIYSTFLQRAYDQILHDVCLQNLHVVFAIDRAGLVGADGETHQGIYDISYLSTIPGLTIMSPKNKAELRDMLEYATLKMDGPVAVRYPRGCVETGMSEYHEPVDLYKNEVMIKGEGLTVLATGVMVRTGYNVVKRLQKDGFNPVLINIRFLDKVDSEGFEVLSMVADHVMTLEENIFTGSYSERLMAYSAGTGKKISFTPVTLPDKYVEQGTVEELRQRYGLDEESIYQKALAYYKEKNAK